MEAENEPLEEEIPIIETIIFRVPCFFFRGGAHSLVYKKCHISFHLGLHAFPPGERGEFRHGTKGGVHLGLGRLGSAVPGGRALPTEEWWKTPGGESWPLGFGRVVFDV